MPRNVSPALLAQVTAAQLRPALFVEIAFENETVCLWSGLGPISAPGPAYSPSASFPYGQTFLGMGWLGSIQSIPQVADVIAQNVTLVLSGIPTELLTDAINAVRQNSEVTIWIGVLDQNNQIVADPEQVFQGSMDVPTITEGAETCSISITVENPLIDLNRAPSRRYTDLDQQMDYPGDIGFFMVQLLQDYNVLWPMPWAEPTTTPPPNYLRITQAPAEGQPPPAIAVGETLQLQCREWRSDGAVADVTAEGPWYSTDDSVAIVGTPGVPLSYGEVKGIGPGMCNIVHRFQQGMFLGSGSTKPSGTVEAAISIVVTPAAS